MITRYRQRRAVYGWAFYDWANSAFSLSVVSAFFPVLLAQYWNDGAESAVTTFRLGWANGLASLVVALGAPVLGAVADGFGRRKAMLACFAFLGALSTLALAWVGAGGWPWAVALYVLGSVGFAAGNTLYDSLLTSVAEPDEFEHASALGFGLGYLGSSMLFAVNVWMVTSPETFGLADPAMAIRWAFGMVGVWWVVFTVPCLLLVKEQRAAQRRSVTASFRQLRETVRAVAGNRQLWLFLLAYWLYIDGVYTIIKMAVDYGLSRGLPMESLIGALLVTNLIGFPAALAFGWLGTRIGARRGIFIGLAAYVVATCYAPFLDEEWEFMALAVLIGLVQGGVQSLSRSFYARLIPPAEAAAYFGFYNMLGKFAAILGPVLTGTVTLLTGSQRWGILSVLILFAGGLYLLSRVSEPDGTLPRSG